MSPLKHHAKAYLSAMESDRIRWNEKHAAKTGKGDPDSFLLKNIEKLKPGVTLDLACGRGRHAVFLASLGHQVVGVDISDVALELARKRAAEAGLHLQLLRVDLDDPEKLFEDGSFDHIVCINFRPSDQLLARLPFWLKMNGHFLWCSFNELQAEVSGFPMELALHQRAFLNLAGFQCLVYERFEDETGKRDGYLFVKK